MIARAKWISLALVLALVTLRVTLYAAGVTKIYVASSLTTTCQNGNIAIKTGSGKGLYWCDAGSWTLAGLTTSGSSILSGNGSGGLSNVTVGSGLSFTGGTLSSSGGGGGGGGSVTVYTGTYASKPGTCASGDVYLPTDSFYETMRCNGSNTWVPTHYSDPANYSWSWSGTQGGAAVDTTHGGIILTAPPSTSRNYRGYVHTAPATPYYAAARIRTLNKWDSFYINVGIGFANSSSIGREVFGPFNNGGPFLNVRLLSDQTTYVSDPGNANSYTWNTTGTPWVPTAVPELFECLSDDGTNRKFWYSNDGYTWFAVSSEARTATFTPDRVGIFADAEQAVDSAYIALVSWNENSTGCSING